MLPWISILLRTCYTTLHSIYSRGVPQGPQLLSVGRLTDHPPHTSPHPQVRRAVTKSFFLRSPARNSRNADYPNGRSCPASMPNSTGAQGESSGRKWGTRHKVRRVEGSPRGVLSAPLPLLAAFNRSVHPLKHAC
eukprot:1178796-Prorocentrum_minimum.AAC.2